jgi:hypothetical protein
MRSEPEGTSGSDAPASSARWVPLSPRALKAALFAAGSWVAAYLIHRGGHAIPLGNIPYEIVWWLPIAFALQSTATAVLGVVGRRHNAVYGLDLLAWSGPIVLLLGAQLGLQASFLLLAVCIFIKAAAGFGGLWLAVGDASLDRAAGWFIAAVGAAFSVVSVPFVRVASPPGWLTGDEPHYLVIALALIRNHDLFVGNIYRDKLYSPFYFYTFMGPDHADGHTVAAVGGHLASFHDVGLPVLDIVPYLLGGWVAVVCGMGLLGGLVLREVFLTARLAGASPRSAVFASALVGLSLPLAVYSTENYPEVPIALAVIVATRQLWTAAERHRGHVLVFGLAIATLPWLHVRAWAFALVLGFFGLLVWRRWTARLLAIGPLILGALGYVWLNDITYGRPLLSPVFAWAAGHPIPFPPLSRLLVAPLGSPWLDGRDGLLLLSPFMVLAVAATPLAIRRGVAGVATVCAAAAYVGTMGLWYTFTGGGAALPGRYMVAVVPLLGVMLALALDRLFRARRARLLTSAFLIPTCAWSLALSFLLFADRPQALTVTGPATYLADLFGLPLRTLVIPNFVSPGAGSYVKVAIMLALVVFAGLVVSRVTSDGDVHGPVAPSAIRPGQMTAGVARNAS